MHQRSIFAAAILASMGLQSGNVAFAQDTPTGQMSSPYPAPSTYTTHPAFDLRQPFHTESAWKAVVTVQTIEPNSDGKDPGHPSQSRICLVNESTSANNCTHLQKLFDSNYSYWSDGDLQVVPLKSHGIDGLMLKATAIYDTGTVNYAAVWLYDRERDQFLLAYANGDPQIFITEPLDGYLVTSSWVWEPGETRFGDDHRRKITAYRLEPGGYQQALQYNTEKKYGPEDLNTIDSELPNIESKLDLTGTH
jgi:hypothetical protein